MSRLFHRRRTVAVSVLLLGVFLSILLLASSATPAVKAANGVIPVQFTFTKWFISATTMTGFVDDDPVGSFSGTLLSFSETPPGCGTTVQCQFYDLTAEYDITPDDPSQSFSAVISGRQNIALGSAVLDGFVTSGWQTGSPVHVKFQQISCTQAPNGVCFQGVISIP